MNELRNAVEQVRKKLARYAKTGVNEQNTKATLIQPILRALGWNVEDIDDVHLEYKQKSKDKPVDFALLINRTPALFVEAKALGETLDDRKWANQMMGYAAVAGVEWVVLTDGDEYRIYNSHATVPVDGKLFRKFRVSNDSTGPVDTLSLLSKDQMQKRNIDVLWETHFIDRQVQGVLQSLFAADREPDISLIRLVHKKIPKLSVADIEAGLRRLEIQVTCPMPTKRQKPSSLARPPEKLGKKKEAKTSEDVSLADLIRDGLISAPLQIFKTYKGVELRAVVQSDGTVEFDGNTYASCSAAADSARASVVGGKPSTNGWEFWKFKSATGDASLLDKLRQEFFKRRKRTEKA